MSSLYNLGFLSFVRRNWVLYAAKGLKFDLDFNFYCIILHVLWRTDQLDGSKLCIAIHAKLACISDGFFKRHHISFGQKSATDVVTELCTSLIQDGEGDSCSEGPFQRIIILSLQHANKQAHVSSNAAVYTIWEDSHAQLVSIKGGVYGRTLQRCYLAVDSILKELGEPFYTPMVGPLADTPRG